MHITFVLPGPARRPVGGYRVVYEYAQRLALRGHAVSVLHALVLPWSPGTRPWPVRYLAHAVLGTARPGWGLLSRNVDARIVPTIADKYVPEGDAVIATWWATAYGVASLRPSCGRKFYLVQHHEIWGGPHDLVNRSYQLGLANVVVSAWLKERLERLGAPVATHIPNGIDLDLFQPRLTYSERDQSSVLWMYHPEQWKGPQEGMRALEIAKEAVPHLTATAFSTYGRPAALPRWVEFVRNPRQQELANLYNKHAVFLHSSRVEGWGLPPAEAMACGCAVVASDSGGIRDFAINGSTAILSGPGHGEELGRALVRVLTDHDLRVKLASRGMAHIREFSWERAAARFEEFMLQHAL